MLNSTDDLLAALRALPAEELRRLVAAAVAPEDPDAASRAALQAELSERDRIELELLKSQQQLAESNQVLQLVLDTIPVRVYWRDRSLRYLGGNQRFADDAGLATPDALVGTRDADLAWSAEATRREAEDRSVIESGEPLFDRIEARPSPDGRLRWVRITRVPLRSRADVVIGVLGTYDDVTERRQLQQRLHEAEYLEAVAQLAGGVAHDFNNLLTGILGSAELIHDDAEPGSDVAESAVGILHAARRAADLTQQLLAFSRRGRMQSQPVDLHALIEQTARLTTHGAGQRVTVTTRLQARRSTVVGDPTQLGSALIDLTRNACEAMPDGGRLLLGTRDVTLTAEEAARLGPDLVAGTYVEICVEDTGVGVPAEIVGRIFEPFFTTKGPGEGSGLGLAAVFGCVKGHGGHVAVASAPGRGTTFTLLLPVGTGPMRKSTPVSTPRSSPSGARILVVDDEETVRAFLARALSKLGYEVLAFPDGAAFLEHHAAHPGEADLVILDLTMPTLGGEETFRRLQAIDPEARVLIASGHSRQAAAGALLEAGARGFLAKPFRIHQLAEAVAAHVRPPPSFPGHATAG